MRTIQLLITSLALLLSACTSAPPKRINPPSVSIQRLAILADGGYDIALRLHNHSDVTMRFAAIDLRLRIAGIDAGVLRAAPDLDVSPHNAEIVNLRLVAEQGQTEPLNAAENADRAPDRVPKGEREHENQDGEWIEVPIDATRRADLERVLTDPNDTTVDYQLRGTVRVSEPERDYDLVFDSRLSPVPGKPGEFR